MPIMLMNTRLRSRTRREAVTSCRSLIGAGRSKDCSVRISAGTVSSISASRESSPRKESISSICRSPGPMWRRTKSPRISRSSRLRLPASLMFIPLFDETRESRRSTGFGRNRRTRASRTNRLGGLRDPASRGSALRENPMECRRTGQSASWERARSIRKQRRSQREGRSACRSERADVSLVLLRVHQRLELPGIVHPDPDDPALSGRVGVDSFRLLLQRLVDS